MRKQSRSTKLPIIAAVLFAILALGVFTFSFSRISTEPQIHSGNVDIELPKPDIANAFNTSIAVYTIGGIVFKYPVDKRGDFWEFQLKSFPQLNASLEYVSDEPFSVNGVDFKVLPNGDGKIYDQKLCNRTTETFRHFMKYHSDAKWYYRGTHDSFINVTALMEMLEDFESKGDPYTTFHMAFNCHEYGYQLYPHGGTGYLFSNYAIKQFERDSNIFFEACEGGMADDITMNWFIRRYGYESKEQMTNKFIVTWPNQQGDIIYNKLWNKIPKCPPYYQLYPDAPKMKPCPARTAVSIHMHRVPMDQAWEQMTLVPPNVAVFFVNPNVPEFCTMT